MHDLLGESWACTGGSQEAICGPEASKLAIAVPTISSSSCSYFYRYRCGRYEELKPPSSPSPTPPSAASSASVSASPDTPPAAAASSAALDSSANGTPITGDQLNQQQSPLSPYTSYMMIKLRKFGFQYMMINLGKSITERLFGDGEGGTVRTRGKGIGGGKGEGGGRNPCARGGLVQQVDDDDERGEAGGGKSVHMRVDGDGEG
uniref:Uncharacterized protein n=1 Tax=Oryza sativa subsp. japonica TaxID=39947 RepID=Q8W3D3_ORYSJ|nr:Unknown protein [Oryza sativa Japonica Group]AAM08641.1 Hypothetical protein [Oryza sativa Japonica Group]